MPKEPTNKPKPEEVEIELDGWDRFRKTMDRIIPPKRLKKNQKVEKMGGQDKPDCPDRKNK